MTSAMVFTSLVLTPGLVESWRKPLDSMVVTG